MEECKVHDYSDSDVESSKGAKYQYLPSSWIEHSQDKSWLYLLENPESGKLVCVKRGKLLMMIAGPVDKLYC